MSQRLHEGLLKTAEDLLKTGKGRPSEANLRRAVSSVYYALFHYLAKLCADHFIGTQGAKSRSKSAGRQVYRALHGVAKTACEAVKTPCKKKKNKIFPKPIQVYASLFVEYQKKRHDADYDPYAHINNSNFTKEDITAMIKDAKDAIKAIKTVPISDLKAFSVFIMLKKRG